MTEGKAIGKTFSKGLHKASAATGKNALNLRALVGGHRPTSLPAVAILLDSLESVDLRDNNLAPEALPSIGRALSSASSLTKLVLAGNPLDAATMGALFDDVASGHTVLTEIDVSRTRLGGDAAEAIEMMSKLGSAISKGRASSLTEAGPRPSACTTARRVGSARARKVSSRVGSAADMGRSKPRTTLRSMPKCLGGACGEAA